MYTVLKKKTNKQAPSFFWIQVNKSFFQMCLTVQSWLIITPECWIHVTSEFLHELRSNTEVDKVDCMLPDLKQTANAYRLHCTCVKHDDT